MAATASRTAGAAALATACDAALQRYADRGVFRAFSAAKGTRGTRVYTFLWLTKRPMIVSLHPGRKTLSFQRLFPAAASSPGVARALRETLRARHQVDAPKHRRIDRRQLDATILGRAGDSRSLS